MKEIVSKVPNEVAGRYAELIKEGIIPISTNSTEEKYEWSKEGSEEKVVLGNWILVKRWQPIH